MANTLIGRVLQGSTCHGKRWRGRCVTQLSLGHDGVDGGALGRWHPLARASLQPGAGPRPQGARLHRQAPLQAGLPRQPPFEEILGGERDAPERARARLPRHHLPQASAGGHESVPPLRAGGWHPRNGRARRARSPAWGQPDLRRRAQEAPQPIAVHDQARSPWQAGYASGGPAKENQGE